MKLSPLSVAAFVTVGVQMIVGGCHKSTPLDAAERRFNDAYLEGAPIEEVCEAARDGKRLAASSKTREYFSQWSARVALYCEY